MANATTSNIRNKIEYNLGDNRFGVVKWATVKPKFSVVPMDTFVKLEKDDIFKLNSDYKLKYKSSKYIAKLLIIGTEEECNKHLEILIDFELRSASATVSAKKPIYQASSKKSINDHSNQIEINENEVIKSEVIVLRAKLNESKMNEENLTKLVEEKTLEIKKLESTNQSTPAVLNISEIDKQKWISIAINILNSFATVEDLSGLIIKTNNSQEKTVIISDKYPDFRMPFDLKLNLEALIRIKKPDTVIFRNLITGIFSDEVLSDNNGQSLKSGYPIIDACKDFVSTKYNTFDDRSLKKCLRELCNEAKTRKGVLKNNKSIDAAKKNSKAPTNSTRSSQEDDAPPLALSSSSSPSTETAQPISLGQHTSLIYKESEFQAYQPQISNQPLASQPIHQINHFNHMPQAFANQYQYQPFNSTQTQDITSYQPVYTAESELNSFRMALSSTNKFMHSDDFQPISNNDSFSCNTLSNGPHDFDQQ